VSSESVDVVVVGAGFAGLSAARALGKRGLSARVLEARDRTGGRTYTKVLPGGPWVDLGGQWIGPTQDRVLRLVEELGVETFPTYTAGHNLLVVRGKKSRYRGTIPRLDPMSLLNISFAQWRLESMSRKVPLEAPWRTAKAAEWDARTLASFLDANVKTRTARTLIEVGLETVFAASSKEMSLLHALFYIRSGKDLDMLLGTEGGAQATRIKGGMQRLAERLAEGLDVRLSAPVRRIEHDGSGVTAHADGASIRAQRAVVSVPPKLASQMAFDPPLVGPRAELVTKTPMGAAIKCTAVYEEPFWRDDGLSGMCVSDEGPIHVTFDNSPPEGTPGVLMGFCDADSARARQALRSRAARRGRRVLRALLRRAREGAARLRRSCLGARSVVRRLLRRVHAAGRLDVARPGHPRARGAHPLRRDRDRDRVERLHRRRHRVRRARRRGGRGGRAGPVACSRRRRRARAPASVPVRSAHVVDHSRADRARCRPGSGIAISLHPSPARTTESVTSIAF
jgi:monoamine oxidase